MPLLKEFQICFPEGTILRTILFTTYNKSTTLGPFKKLVILILGSLYKTISVTFLNIYWVTAKFIFSYKIKVCLAQFTLFLYNVILNQSRDMDNRAVNI